MKLDYDLRKLYLDALAPQPGERVTFINDFPQEKDKITDAYNHRAEMTATWHAVMVKLGEELGLRVEPVVTIDLFEPAAGKFSADGYVNGRAVNLDEIMNSWGEKDIVIAITGPSITGELVRRLGVQKFRFASAPNVTAYFEGFRADYAKIPLRFEILTHAIARAVAAEMRFRYNGHMWLCTFDLRGQRYQFKECGAAHRPGEFINLPSGCANVPPYAGIENDVRGPSQTEGDIPALLKGELVVYRINQNKIYEIVGDGPNAAREREHILDPAHPEQAVITKLGLGVNDTARCNGAHVGDEKTMGMHWGHGPAKHFPDTIWAEHPIGFDMDFIFPGGSRLAVFRNNRYDKRLGDVF